MQAPKYFEKFKCTADRCTHSCCVGWEIDVDEETLARYLALPDAKGAWIKDSIVQDGEYAHFRLCTDERCPHLDERGLCRIIKALGEGYPCDICREHPRYYNPVGGEWECGIGASCEEAARLILAEEDYRTLVPVETGECAPKYDTYTDFCAKTWREQVFALLSDKEHDLEERCALIEARFGVPAALEPQAQEQLLASLEYLDGAHRALLLSCAGVSLTGVDALACERFLAYLIYRHASPAQGEGDFRLMVGFSLFVMRLFAALTGEKGLSPVRAAVLLSEELEYSVENTEAICRALASDMWE